MQISDFEGKKVLVVGLGVQGGGVGVARFFAHHGAHVTVTDLKSEADLQDSIAKLQSLPITFSLGAHKESDFLEANYIIKGPSVPWTMPELQKAEAKGVPVLMEAGLFATLCQTPLVGITGTRGKSTTTQMIYDCLQRAGKKALLGGNIPGQATLELLDQITPETEFIVLELSSWQLSGFHRVKISPHIAVFTNIYPDHLNYYPSMAEYFHDKTAIYAYQNSEDVLFASSSLQEKIAAQPPASQVVYVKSTEFPGELPFLLDEHNRENAALAYAVVQKLGVPANVALATIQQFKPLPFRLAAVGKRERVTFMNDTTSTTPVATIKALQAFAGKPVYIIFGGNSKNLPTDEVVQALNQAKGIFLLGGTMTDVLAPILKKQYSEKVHGPYSTFAETIKVAYEAAQKESEESYVLLSPGGTSFALFKNEFDRGEQFNRLVAELIST